MRVRLSWGLASYSTQNMAFWRRSFLLISWLVGLLRKLSFSIAHAATGIGPSSPASWLSNSALIGPVLSVPDLLVVCLDEVTLGQLCCPAFCCHRTVQHLSVAFLVRWQWHQLDHMQIIRTSLQTHNHASTSSVSFYRPNAFPATQPIASNHWRHLWLWNQLIRSSLFTIFTASLWPP